MLRNKELQQLHVNTAQAKGGTFFGVKKACIFTERLAHFYVTSGYPPDVVHDLFEGIVPVELVKEKMEKTFAYRRHEVIEEKPFIAEFKRRWPALFSEHEVSHN